MNKSAWLVIPCIFASVAALGQAVPPTQITPTNDTGVKQYQTYSGAHENINLANGNLSLNIPLLSLPGRNGLSLNLDVHYNSKIWSPHGSYGSNSDLVYNWQAEQNGWPVGDLGWAFNIPFGNQGNIITDDMGNPIGLTPSIFSLPNGSKTSFESPHGALTPGTYMDSQDGSFATLSGGIVLLKDGTQIEGTGSTSTIRDANGNFVTYNMGVPVSQITDTLGRQVTLTETGSYPSKTITISNKDSNGAPQNIVLTLSALTLFQTTGDPSTNQYYTGSTPFQNPHPSGNATSASHVWVSQPSPNSQSMMLTRIDMPGNISYTFSYNGYGELTQITYPSGGYTKYTYAAFQHGEMFWTGMGRIAEQGGLNIEADFRELTSKRVCHSASGACSQNEEDVITYAPTIISTLNVNNDSVDVKHFLDEANNIFEKTTVQFTNDTIMDTTPQYYSPRETMRSMYASNGTLLRTVQTSYNSEADLPGYVRFPISVVTKLYDVDPPLVTKTDTQYDTYSATVLWPAGAGYQFQTAQLRTRFIDNPLTQTMYDFGPNAAGSALGISNTAWWKADWGNHVWNRPLTQEVQDGMGTRLAYTTFEYDNYTEGVTVSGAIQRGSPYCATSPNCSMRGNQTAVSDWRNTDGAMLTTRSQFDDAGNVRKVTDPLGHSTTFSFADNWTNGNSACAPASGAAAAYPTLVTNALGHQSITTYNSCTGTVATHLDPNGQTTTTTYDALNRPLTVTLPDGGFTQYTYGSPTHTTVQIKPASGVTDTSQWPTTETYLDGLGRGSQVGVKNGETGSGWDVKTTCYDTRGYATFSSYSTQASAVPVASPCSLPGDTLQVDALSRVTQVAHSDGSTILTEYAGRAKRVKDEGKDASGNRVTRVTQVDALGRLTSVCEKSSANQMGGNNAPAACGQDIAETGFLTTYQYDIHDPAGSAMQVAQPGLANRYFVYDSLGNLLSANNPESGTTRYTYNDDGTLHTRIRPKPNQTSASVLVTTTYTYDAIHRLKQTDYDDNNTASVFMLYDQASATTGQGLTNSVGRLTTVSTSGGQSVDLYSYDSMGRITSNWQCTPAQNCSTGMKQLVYGYDLVGNTTSASNGFGVNIGYTYNVANRIQSATSSLVNAAHPATLMSNLSYGPFGLTSATFGNGVQEARGYTARGQLGSISDTVTITHPPVSGSGSVTISGSERTIGGPPATSGTGSVTLSGSIQSTQVVNQPAAAGSGTVNIAGSEHSTQVQSSPGTPGQGSISVSGTVLRGYDDAECGCYIYDSGTISVWVNGARIDTTYSQGTSATQVASSIASQIACCSNVVTATNSGGSVTLTARTNHANTFYAVSVSQSSNRQDVFPSGSFTVSWTNVTGGSDPTYSALYDTGSVTATVNGFSKSTGYGQSSTTATVASGLASAFNGDTASPVTGSASGASLTLTSKATGVGTNYTLSASSSTSQGAYFSQPSFTASAASSTLLGGHDATYNTLYDSGSIGITVNGVTKSTPYGQNSTPSGLASALATLFNNDSSAPVNASASGAAVSLTSRATGVAANYPLSTSSSTSQGTYFSSPSFSSSASGSTLAGGQNAGAPITDTGTVSITVNGYAKSVPYTQTSTASSVASALSNAFNGDASSPVHSTVSGATITVIAKAAGASTNYALTASSTTTNSSFTGTSFPASAPGASLTGGADGTQTPTTPYSVALTFMPNGNIATANDNVNGNWTYSHDDFNRLAGGSSAASAYNYAYDRYGNRWQQNVVAGTGYASSLTFSGGNNRTDQFSYDAAGNQLSDGQGHSLTYDAENRIVDVGSNVSYVYDGEGRRVRKTVGGVSLDFLYDLGDRVIAEMSSSGGWNRGEVFAAGRHIATYANSATYFAHSDWLGTERARTQVNGAVCETIQSLPYGDGQSTSGSCYPSPNFFTGKERDAETNLDYFGARYYSNGLGRFVTPDWAAKATAVPYAEFSDPQSLNLYTYVRNVPTARVDSDGHWPTILDALLSKADQQRLAEALQQFSARVGSDLKEAGKEGLVLALCAYGCEDASSTRLRQSVQEALSGGSQKDASIGTSTTTNQLAGSEEGTSKESNYVYRGLAKGEDPSKGLTARSPNAGNDEMSHVAGKRESQWISTTKSEALAREKFGENGVVRIDLNKVNGQVSDVSGGFPGKPGMLSNWAIKTQEVLIKNSIPPQAIEIIK